MCLCPQYGNIQLLYGPKSILFPIKAHTISILWPSMDFQIFFQCIIYINIMNYIILIAFSSCFHLRVPNNAKRYSSVIVLIMKGLRSVRWKRRNSPYIFQVVASLPTKACLYSFGRYKL